MKFILLLLLASRCFATVIFQSQWQGADGATTSAEEAQGLVLTFNANAQIDTAQAPTGLSSSLLVDGTGDFVSTPDNNGFDFSTGDFTIGIWVRFATVGSDSIISHYVGGACTPNCGFALLQTSSSNIRFVRPSDLATNMSWSPSVDTWYYIEIDKSANVIYFFIDGTLLTAGIADTGNYNAAATLNVGRVQTTTEDFNGWFGPAYINNGTALHTANFTPPLLPLPMPNSSDTLSPYMKNSNRLDMTPPRLFMWLPSLFVGKAHAMSADNRAEGQRNQQLYLNDITRYNRVKLDGDILAGRVTSTKTVTPDTRPKKTPTPTMTRTPRP